MYIFCKMISIIKFLSDIPQFYTGKHHILKQLYCYNINR